MPADDVVGWILPAADAIGVAAFAATGALAAGRKGMDITGFALLAIVTGVGGGTLRDLLLGVAPVTWINEPSGVIICLCVAVITFVGLRRLEAMKTLILWCDAIGLAVFAVTGAQMAVAQGASPVIACAMGVITATFGGIIRDVLSAEVPMVLKREIYVTAALLGAATYVAAQSSGLGETLAITLGTGAGLGLRALAILRGWSLPTAGR